MLGNVAVHLADQVGVVGAVFIEPEDNRPARRLRTIHGEFDPVADGAVLDAAQAPDVTFFNIVFNQRRTGTINDTDLAVTRRFEGGVV